MVIASTSRSYAMDEKIAMGDGRYDQRTPDRRSIESTCAATRLLIDMAALAKQSGAIVNAVMLGAIAACGPAADLAPKQFEAAIRADGKAVDANLRGFRAGLRSGARAKLLPQNRARA